MQRNEVVRYCLDRPGARLDTPWDDDEVAKVGDKIFCFLGAPSASGSAFITVKNEPEAITEWRARYPDHVTVPRYLKKTLWNRVDIGAPGGPDDEEIRELVDDSYRLIVESLPKSRRPTG